MEEEVGRIIHELLDKAELEQLQHEQKEAKAEQEAEAAGEKGKEQRVSGEAKAKAEQEAEAAEEKKKETTIMLLIVGLVGGRVRDNNGLEMIFRRIFRHPLRARIAKLELEKETLKNKVHELESYMKRDCEMYCTHSTMLQG